MLRIFIGMFIMMTFLLAMVMTGVVFSMSGGVGIMIVAAVILCRVLFMVSFPVVMP